MASNFLQTSFEKIKEKAVSFGKTMWNEFEEQQKFKFQTSPQQDTTMSSFGIQKPLAPKTDYSNIAGLPDEFKRKPTFGKQFVSNEEWKKMLEPDIQEEPKTTNFFKRDLERRADFNKEAGDFLADVFWGLVKESRGGRPEVGRVGGTHEDIREGKYSLQDPAPTFEPRTTGGNVGSEVYKLIENLALFKLNQLEEPFNVGIQRILSGSRVQYYQAKAKEIIVNTSKSVANRLAKLNQKIRPLNITFEDVLAVDKGVGTPEQITKRKEMSRLMNEHGFTANEILQDGRRQSVFPKVASYLDDVISDIKNTFKGLSKEEQKLLASGGETKPADIVDSYNKATAGIEPSVLQKVDKKTGKVTFKTIEEGKLSEFDKLVDNTQTGIAGEDIGGEVFHLTAKTPEQMKATGAEFTGTAQPTDVPKTKIKTTETKDGKDPFGWFDEARRRLENEYHPIEKVGKLAKKKGVEVPSWQDPELLVKRNLGAVGVAEGELLGLGDIVRPYNAEIDTLNEYLIAKRSIDLEGRDIKTGVKGAEETIAKLEPQFKEVADQLYMYQRSILHNYLVDTGMLSEESFQAIIEQNPNYVPFKRLFEEAGIEYVPKKKAGVPIKKIKGSEREILNPIESIIENTYKAVTAGEQNRLWRSVANLGEQLPELGITKMKPTMVPVAKVDGKAVFRPSFYNPKPNTISFFENGKRVFYETPPAITKVFNSLGERTSNIFMKILSFPTKIVRTGATGANPEFALIRNPIRDQLSALWNSESGYVPFLDMMKGISHYAGNDDLYRQYLLSGASQSFMVSLDREFKNRTLKGLLSGRTIIKEGNLLSKVQDVSQITEAGTRLGEFGKALERTSDPLKAAKASREVTVDFGRIGKDTRVANQLIAFINARVQGTIQASKSAMKHPVRSSIIGLGLGSIPAILLYIHNRQYPEWQDIQDWEKKNNWIVLYGEPGDAKMFEIPKDYIIGKLFANTTENFLTYIDKTDPEAMSKLANNVFEFFSPVSNIGEALPTATKPILEHAFNYNTFLEREIVPEYQEALPPEAQYNSGTREIAKLIGTKIGVSPAVIDNYLYGYGPGIIAETINLVDFALGGKKFSEVEKLPFIRAFTISGTGKVDHKVKDIYYEIQDKKKTLSGIARSKNYTDEQKKALIEKQLKEMGELSEELNNYTRMQQGEAGVTFSKDKVRSTAYSPPGMAGEVEAAEKVSESDYLITKEQFRYSDSQTITIGDKTLYKKDDEVRTINWGSVISMKEETTYQKALKKKKAYTLVDDVLDNLPVEQQAEVLEKLGISADDANYYNVARQDNYLKSVWVNDEVSRLSTSKDRGDMLNYLVSLRREVNNKMILTNGVIDDLYDSGIISASEKTALKNTIIGEDGKAKVKLSGRGAKTTLKKVTLPTPKKVEIMNMTQLLSQENAKIKSRRKKYKFIRHL